MNPSARSVVDLDDYRTGALVTIGPGDYDAVYVGHQCLSIFRVQKVRVDFRLLAHPGLIVSRWYRASFSRGRISAANSSDIVRELSEVLSRRVRQDRIPITALGNRIVVVRVRTVLTDSRQDALSEINRYSVIGKLLECVQ